METRVDEIAPRIYRLSTFVPTVAPPAGFTFNQFLVDADEPLLYHLGPRALFPSVSAAVARVVPLERLRWLGFSHTEADECGALGSWLAAAPQATVVHGPIGSAIWLNDALDVKPRVVADGEVLDLGGKRVRHLATPHVPHSWDAELLFEETTATLFSSDLLAHTGDTPALARGDILGPATAAEELFKATSLTPSTGATIRRLAALAPRVIAVMHGASLDRDTTATLTALADYFDARLRVEVQALPNR